MKKYLFFAAAIAATLASCSSDAEDAPAIENSSKDVKYLLASQPFEFVDGTRTTFTLKENTLAFSWDFSETFGVFPISPATNNQAVWRLNKRDSAPVFTNDTHYAQFGGEGWQLFFGETYAAYQPYQGGVSSDTPYTAVPVEMPSTQGGTLAYIGSNVDYMHAVGTYNCPEGDDTSDPNDGHQYGDKRNDVAGHEYNRVIFDFNHAISIVQIKVPYPDDATGIEVVAQNGNPFITAGTWNIETGVVTGTSFTNTISLTTPETVENGIATFYAAIFPTTTGACNINVLSGGLALGNSVTSKKLEAGKAYRWNVTNN